MNYKRVSEKSNDLVFKFFSIVVGLLLVIMFLQYKVHQKALNILDRPDSVHCGYITVKYSSNYCISQITDKQSVFVGWDKVNVLITGCKFNLYDYVCFSSLKHNNSKFWNRFGVFMQAELVYDLRNDLDVKASFREGSITDKYFMVLRFFNDIKEKLYRRLVFNSDPDVVGLILGVLFGDARFINPSITEIFKKMGLIHILVVSGYNISIFVTLLELLLSSYQWTTREIYASINIIIISWLIVFVGPSPPVLRAFGFWGIGMLFRLFGARLNNLAKFFYTAVYLFIFINPFWIFSISAILSFTASFGVIFLAPLISRLLEKLYLPGFIPETLGAMLATSPILFLTFGVMPNVKVFLANVIILPLIDVITLIGYLVMPLLIIPSFGIDVFVGIAEPLFGILLFLVSVLVKILSI